MIPFNSERNVGGSFPSSKKIRRELVRLKLFAPELVDIEFKLA